MMELRQRIDLLVGRIVAIMCPENVEKMCRSQVSEFRMSWMKKGGRLLFLPKGGGIELVVSFRYDQDERLITFLHELFHFPFIHQGIHEGALRMDESDYDYLEKSIDDLAEEFVRLFPEWSAAFFEECFGFRHTDFVTSE